MQQFAKWRQVWVLGVGIVVVTGCTKSFEGEYSDPEKVEIVDDKWNETDARKTGQDMITSMMGTPWLEAYKKAHNGEKPVVIVDEVENRTDEHIDSKALTEAIQDALINSQKVRFVNAAKRQKILDEIKYQQSGAVAAKSAKKGGQQTGADYILGGAISSSVHTQGGLKTVTYQTNLTLTNLESAEIEWSGKYDIKKRFNRSGARW